MPSRSRRMPCTVQDTVTLALCVGSHGTVVFCWCEAGKSWELSLQLPKRGLWWQQSFGHAGFFLECHPSVLGPQMWGPLSAWEGKGFLCSEQDLAEV